MYLDKTCIFCKDGDSQKLQQNLLPKEHDAYRKRLISAVKKTILAKAPDVVPYESSFVKALVSTIYRFAVMLEYTKRDMLNFIAVAMHNTPKFSNMPKNSDPSDVNISRGLMQIVGNTNYSNLISSLRVSAGDYAFLEEYDSFSVYAEMLWFKTYNAGLQFQEVIKTMGSSESKLIVESYDNMAKDVVKTHIYKLRRRYNIFFVLHAELQKQENAGK
ncbi:hypothetical protein ENBRE01_2004 [Enteropsectra breve]|nr:hypothetical protein ENBRE01_2004 [Enteropsectra breve]